MAGKPTFDILLATYEGNLADVRKNIPSIVDFCRRELKHVRWRITIAYNGKPPSSWKDVIQSFQSFRPVRITYVSRPGKGSAILNGIWSSSATYVAYMDADIATDLHGIPTMVHQLMNGKDIVSGSRYHPHSSIRRDGIRLLVSLFYTQFFLRFLLGARFTDPQCGFKGFNRERIRPLLPRIQDAWFFFETELLFAAQKAGISITEIPIRWEEKGNSSVKLVPTIINFLKNLYRIRTQSWTAISSPPSWLEKSVVIREAPFN